MTYIFRCHLCNQVFNSFQELSLHKSLELETISRIKQSHPEWHLRECFEFFRSHSDNLSAGSNRNAYSG